MSVAVSHALSVDRTHPSLPGHFPGSAVVPGVVFLSYILTELRRQLPELEVRGVRKLKFLRMLLPEQSFVVEFAAPERSSLRFKCWRHAAAADQGANQVLHDSKRDLLVDGHLLVSAPGHATT